MGEKGWEVGIIKGLEETSGSDGYVHYLDYDDGFTGI